MPRRGRSTTVGKIAQLCQARRASEIRILGELLRREQRTETRDGAYPQPARDSATPR
ncbi:hypothetical protein ACFFMR_32835 [Micromonospora andamanensis]|uniref:Uncharacterized protein n=1 Tax=Micromonospora andamanensis TaxID=1287068 RepID=A0ABQ4I2N7_9ACTN|nr:hypothetical protein [Micromonospora andamanensis]GIJ12175.1 hypothetical protein Van01_53890 [Micromonospora andamanensis]